MCFRGIETEISPGTSNNSQGIKSYRVKINSWAVGCLAVFSINLSLLFASDPHFERFLLAICFSVFLERL